MRAFTESVCETEIKVRQHGGYTVLAVFLGALAFGLVGANKALLDRLNRLHAIARGDIYSEVMGGEPPREDETPESVRGGEGRGWCVRARRSRACLPSPAHHIKFVSFTTKFIIGKALFTFTAVVRHAAGQRAAAEAGARPSARCCIASRVVSHWCVPTSLRNRAASHTTAFTSTSAAA